VSFFHFTTLDDWPMSERKNSGGEFSGWLDRRISFTRGKWCVGAAPIVDFKLDARALSLHRIVANRIAYFCRTRIRSYFDWLRSNFDDSFDSRDVVSRTIFILQNTFFGFARRFRSTLTRQSLSYRFNFIRNVQV
jgi:hypothetical protein